MYQGFQMRTHCIGFALAIQTITPDSVDFTFDPTNIQTMLDRSGASNPVPPPVW
jgi:hypothetical protein